MILRTVTLDDLAHWVKTVNEPNFKGAPSMAALLAQDTERTAQAKALAAFPCELVLAAACGRDDHNQLWSLHRPLYAHDNQSEISTLLSAAKQPGCLLILDACYASPDQEYRDAKLVNDWRNAGLHPSQSNTTMNR